MKSGFVNVLKPAGATASDIVVKLRHVLGIQKVGHLGTLDPGAIGVLPIALGEATKLFNLLTQKVKRYRATFTFGLTTDTLDSYGTVIGRGKIPSWQSVQDVLTDFVGDVMQVPPSYSAISIGGVRAYDLARRGDSVQINPRCVSISLIEIIDVINDNTIMLDIICGGGTYIRSLARDIACKVDSVAYMSSLIRLQSGAFNIDDALTYSEIEARGNDCVLDIMFPLQDLPRVDIDSYWYKQLSNGVAVESELFPMSKIYCNGEFFGVGSSNGKTRLEYYLKNAKN